MRVEDRLREMGLELPEAPAPIANQRDRPRRLSISRTEGHLQPRRHLQDRPPHIHRTDWLASPRHGSWPIG